MTEIVMVSETIYVFNLKIIQLKSLVYHPQKYTVVKCNIMFNLNKGLALVSEMLAAAARQYN